MKMRIEGKKFHSCIDAVRDFRDEGLIRLNDDNWYMQVADESNSAMSGVRVPNSAMEEYDRGDVDVIGVRFEELANLVPKSSDVVTFKFEPVKSRLYIEGGNYDVRITTVEPDTVAGASVDVPNIERPVVIQDNPSIIKDFLGQARSVDEDWFMIMAEEDTLYLYAKGDTARVIETYSFSDLYNVDTDWSIANDHKDYSPDYDAVEDKKIKSMFSVDFVDSMIVESERAQIEIGDHIPMKITQTTEDKMNISYIIAPRIPSEDTPLPTLEDE